MCRVLNGILLLKQYVNTFERMDNAEYIYEGVVEPYYEQSSREYATGDVHRRKNRR